MDINNQVTKTDELCKMNKTFIQNHSEEFKRHDMVLQSYKKNFDEIYSKVRDMDEKKIEMVKFQEEVTKVNKDIDLIKFMNEDVAQTILLTDNYIEKYLPVAIQNQISETMINVLGRRDLQKLFDFDRKKYRQLV